MGHESGEYGRSGARMLEAVAVLRELVKLIQSDLKTAQDREREHNERMIQVEGHVAAIREKIRELEGALRVEVSEVRGLPTGPQSTLDAEETRARIELTKERTGLIKRVVAILGAGAGGGMLFEAIRRLVEGSGA